LTQILPLLRGQPKLTSLAFDGFRIKNGLFLLFEDPESTQVFVDNILLSPPTALMTLSLYGCGISLENRPLMAAFHKNTTIVELGVDYDDATRLFIVPILQRNRYLGHVHDMLGTRKPATMLLPTATLPAVVAPNTIPPPCGLWATVLAKVGHGAQGASPVFTILSDRLATWMEP
jgi:hypothetical protein